MTQSIFNFLKKYGTNSLSIDRLLVSAFINIQNIHIDKNIKIFQLLITQKDNREFEKLQEFVTLIKKVDDDFGFEELLELFEFVISPADKLVNGAIYTPKEIRKYITQQVFQKYHAKDISEVKVSDIACGCGGFLINASEQIKHKTGKKYRDIFKENIFGLDIQPYSVERTKILLSLFAIYHGEEEEEFSFNIHLGNSLSFDWSEQDPIIRENDGFDIILGNPPYVCSRNMDDETKSVLNAWNVCSTGHPDLYIPFFQIGYELLTHNGILGYITVNTFIRSVNGRALRNYFSDNNVALKIIDFEGEQIFKSRVTYTCLAFLTQKPSKNIQYVKSSSKSLNNILSFDTYSYESLDHFQGWSLKNTIFVQKCEAVGTKFGSLYSTRSGIATLKNNVYIFNPIYEDDAFYYLDFSIPIEKAICKEIVNSNLLVRESSIENIKEKMIFPYYYEDGSSYPKPLEEQYLKTTFPKAYQYLLSKREELAKRDKGKGQNYPYWYAFGRTQSMERVKYKLFFPQLVKVKFNSCISDDENLYFYNGMAAYSNDLESLQILQKIFMTDIFWEYIQNVSKNYNSNYYSLGKNFLQNFGIPDLSDKEKFHIISENDPKKINNFFAKKYNIK